VDEKINNAIAVFTSTSTKLEYFINAIKSHIESKPSQNIGFGDAGTTLFAKLHRQNRLPVLRTVGLFSPLILEDIVGRKERYIQKYMKAFGNEIQAANLVHSGFNSNWMGVDLGNELYERVIDRLLETRGEIMNKFCRDISEDPSPRFRNSVGYA
jgi:hypothetical protein